MTSLLPCLVTLLLIAPSVTNAQTTPAPPPVPEYRLEPGDTIDLRFFYNQELNESVQIRPDGLISMPIIGDIRVAGETAVSLAAMLAARYKDIVKLPAITVQVRSFANRRIFVGGEVARPGVFSLIGTQTVLGVVAEAGGMTQRAKRGEIVLVRQGADGSPRMQRVSMTAHGGLPPEAATLRLEPLDVVLVSESGIAKANRAVDQYVRQMIPALVTFGFTYLANATVVGVQE